MASFAEDEKFFASLDNSLVNKLDILEYCEVSFPPSEEERKRAYKSSTRVQQLNTLRDLRITSEHLAEAKVCKKTLVIREEHYDITEPVEWTRKVKAIGNLLQKFECVMDNQSVLEEMLQKDYTTEMMSLDAEYRDHIVELFDNITLCIDTLNEHHTSLEWDEDNRISANQIKDSMRGLSRRLQTLRINCKLSDKI